MADLYYGVPVNIAPLLHDLKGLTMERFFRSSPWNIRGQTSRNPGCPLPIPGALHGFPAAAANAEGARFLSEKSRFSGFSRRDLNDFPAESQKIAFPGIHN